MNHSDKSTAKICEEARRRLEELAPFVEEAERLRTVLAVLEPGSHPLPDGANDRLLGTQVESLKPHVRADKDRILAIIAENPGITAAEIARRSGMKRTVVATTMSRLKRTGELLPDGRGARLPDDVRD